MCCFKDGWLSVKLFVLSPLICFTIVAAHAGEPPKTDELLDQTPVSLTPASNSIHAGYQEIGKISSNMEALYSAACFLEMPVIDEGRPEPFPSRDFEYAPYAVDENTTLRAFLDKACSDGKLQWAVVRNAIHVWPVSSLPGTEDYLDGVAVSLDLNGVSLLEAVNAWAEAVKRNADFEGYGVEIMTPTELRFLANKNFPTPESMLRGSTVTLRVDNVSAREALCGILGASGEWIRFQYHHVTGKEDVLLLFSRKEEMRARPEITAAERARLNELEGHGRPVLNEEPELVEVK